MRTFPILVILLSVEAFHTVSAGFIRVTEELSDLTVNEEGTDRTNDRIILKCGILGEPMPSYKWYRNELPLHADSKFRMTRTYRGSTLRVTRLKPGDSGTYTCVGTNSEGRVSTASHVIVKPAPPIRYVIMRGYVCTSRPLEGIVDVTPHDCQRACDLVRACRSFYVTAKSRSCTLTKCGSKSEDMELRTSIYVTYVKPGY